MSALSKRTPSMTPGRSETKKMNHLLHPATCPSFLASATPQSPASIRPIRNAADFERMHASPMNCRMRFGVTKYPLFSLFEIVLDLIERWEGEHVAIPIRRHEVLRHLLEEHGRNKRTCLRLHRPVYQDILSGRREISKKLAKALAARFNISIDAFV